MPPKHRPFGDHPCAASHPAIVTQAQLFLAMAIGQSTRQSYSSGVNSYLRFVEAASIHPAFPASVETLCLWVSSLAAPPHSLKIGTCKVYLSGVINQHIERGFTSPLENASPMLDRIFTGIKRWSAHQENTNLHAKPKLPITTGMLRLMAQSLNTSIRSDALVLAMIWVATTAMLRISEFTTDHKTQDRLISIAHLSFVSHNGSVVDSLSVDNTIAIRHAVLHLQQSKTDPFRKGVDIIIASPETIQALLRYLSHLRQQRHITAQSPLFSFTNGDPINRQWFMRQVSTLLAAAGYDISRYSSHSFRKGGAVSLQHSGAEDSIIRTLGRWKSDAYHLYLRHPISNTVIHAATRI